MAWYKETGAENDVVISSRIRLARNIADYPFAGKLDKTSASEIIEKVKNIFGGDLEYIDFTKISLPAAASYAEKRYVSPEFVSQENPHALFLNEESGVAVMAIEEDHIRLQCIKAGFSLVESYNTACSYDDLICDSLNIAYDERLGFITCCPTNLGTAMRASVMMFLPALSASGKIQQLVSYLPKIGLTIRGIYGEGSTSDGNMYQISNQVTLGITENEAIEKLTDVIKQIIVMERNERNIIRSDGEDSLCDKIFRSIGILKNAYLMTSNEFMKLYSDIRLGISYGYIKDISYEKLGELMIDIQPASLIIKSGCGDSGNARDKARADYIKAKLK